MSDLICTCGFQVTEADMASQGFHNCPPDTPTVSDLREGAIEAMEEAMRFREPYSGDALDALLDYLTEHYWDHNGPTYGLLAVLAAAKEVSDSE